MGKEIEYCEDVDDFLAWGMERKKSRKSLHGLWKEARPYAKRRGISRGVGQLEFIWLQGTQDDGRMGIEKAINMACHYQ